MKLTNCLRTLLSAFFVMSLLSLTHAGQTGVVVSPSAGGGKVKTDTSKAVSEKVEPGKVKPKAVPEETKVAPKKKKIEIKEPQKQTLPVRCNGKVVTILGTPGADFLIGTSGPDVIHGLGGDDIIRGMGGDDIICGGDGNDKLDGGKGNDILDGGPGRDECINGPSGKGILVAPKNCEKIMTSPKVDISPKTQRKPVGTSGGFVPDKSSQKTQFETQKQYEVKNKTIAVQPDTMKQRSGDTSMGKSTLKPSGFVKFQTHLSVKLPSLKGDKWGKVYKENEWQYLKFRWRTPIGEIPIQGKWQISMFPDFHTIVCDGDAGRVSETGQYQWFYIDFKNVEEQYAIPQQVYVRVVPITESKLYAPSSFVEIHNIVAGHTVFKVSPWIDATLGNPGWDTVSPEGKLYITGKDFGTEKGHIFIYGIGFPNGKLELDPVVWESSSRVNGKVPLITGIKDQKIEVEVVTNKGLVSNRHEHMFLGTRERRVLGYHDAAVWIMRCGQDADFNSCFCPDQWAWDATFCGVHANNFGGVDDEIDWDKFRVKLKNGWNIVDVKIKRILTTDDETLDGPIPNWKYGMTVWEPKFEWTVSPDDRVEYHCTITIEGPKGVPYY